MADFQVLVVEDDQVVARVYHQVVSETPGFRVFAMSSTAEDAMGVLKRCEPIDLVLLDIGLPGVDGTRLLRAIRRQEGPEVIAVTAVRDRKVVRTMLHLGVLDYLIKPFTFERLQHALIRYRNRQHALAADSVSQLDLDSLYSAADRFPLPRELNRDTLEAVRRAVKEISYPAAAKEVAARAFVARVTARRYLEYLTTLRQVECISEVEGPGRPQKKYRWLGMAS